MLHRLSFHRTTTLTLACGCALLLSGCATGVWNAKKAINTVDDGWAHLTGKPDDCDDPWDQFDPSEPGGPEWWARQAELPVGQRQKIKKGKVWPPQPRPVGPPQQFSHKYHTTKYWPWPYVCQDRAVVNQYIDLHTIRGWEKATTLYDYHFDESTGDLSTSGEQHLGWILMHVPEMRQRVFIQKTFDAAQNQARMENVQSRVAVMMGPDNVIPVEFRLDSADGRPAEEVDAIRRAELSVVPVPHILPENAQSKNVAGAGSGGDPAPPGAP